MGKIIFWIVVFFLVLLALRLVSVHKTREDEKERRANEAKPDGKDSKGGKRDDKPGTDVMVKCTRCGVFVPKATSVMTPTGLACNDGSCRHRR